MVYRRRSALRARKVREDSPMEKGIVSTQDNTTPEYENSDEQGKKIGEGVRKIHLLFVDMSAGEKAFFLQRLKPGESRRKRYKKPSFSPNVRKS